MILGLYSPFPQSGKSTVAKHLVEHHSGTVRCSYATPLKRCLSSLVNALQLDIPAGVFETGDRSVEVMPGVTARDLLVEVGMTLREKYPGIFTLPMRRNIEAANRNGFDIIIDDVRYPDELAQIREAGGMVWAVMKPDDPLRTPSRADCLLGRTEEEIHREFGWERTILNNKSMKHLTNEADVLYAMELV